MPEGPEVRVMTDQLSKLTTTYPYLHTFSVIAGRYTRHPFPSLETFQEMLPLKIKSLDCRGKLIYWLFNSNPDWYLLNTLGMSGRWSLQKETHAHIEIVVASSLESSTTQQLTLWFCDPRHFATLTLTRNPTIRFQKIGPDWLHPTASPTLERFKNTFLQKDKKSRNKPTLPKLLMDQSLFSGCGNYLKSEVLYRAKISPHRTPSSLSESEWSLLYQEMMTTIRESYQANGTTLATYATPDGKTGSYFERLKVYNKKHDPLGNLVLRITTPDKRTTHWVPEIQK